MAPQVRLELTTLRLTAECSAIELLRIIRGLFAACLPADGSLFCFQLALALSLGHRLRSHIAFGPVSYTHLDVYKRQVHIWRIARLYKVNAPSLIGKDPQTILHVNVLHDGGNRIAINVQNVPADVFLPP